MFLQPIFALLILNSGSVFGLRFLQKRSEPRFLPAPDWDCKVAGFSCRDCNTLQYCRAPNDREYTVSCKDQYPGRPVCSPAEKECVAEKIKCEEVQNGFKCPYAGQFPDPSDCKKYTSCLKKDDVGITYHCLYSSVFDFRFKKCVTGGMCYVATPECGGKYKVIPYKMNTSFYVVCQGTDAPILKYCGSSYLHFNAQLLNCEFVCKKEGMFPDPDDENKFYQCVKNGKVFVRLHKDCMPNSKFDETIEHCVASDDNSDTSTTTISPFVM